MMDIHITDQITLQDISSSSRQKLMTMLHSDEQIQVITRSHYLKENAAVIFLSLIGSVGLIFFIIFSFQISQTLMMLLSFPLAIIVSVYTWFKHKDSFVAFTNKRVIIKPSLGKRVVVRYQHMLNVKAKSNCLHFCRSELEIEKKDANDRIPKMIYIDALEHQEQFRDLLLREIEKNPGNSLSPHQSTQEDIHIV
eukprot:TRINITY_DN8061_c0_g1_i1.p1 TRINITY_DN8061_c0_g1~~TRINITY_DN8061_c0_g1_i1.p1  ORF type:complete len:214 (-),score=19.02 TRINITY_DN8061_c0_g1_i1:142-726(-)